MKAVEKVGDEIRFNIYPKQQQFISSDLDDILYGGAAGGGKSYSVMLGAAKRRMEHPGTYGIIFRRTFPELEKSIVKESRKIYPLLGAKYNSTKHQWVFGNGSIQEFGYCFDDKTEILTENGWKLFKDVLPEEKVSTVNKEGEILFVKPENHIAYHYKGPMVTVEQRNGISFSVTPEHRFLINKKNNREWTPLRIERAIDIKGTSRLQRAFTVGERNISSVEFGSVKGGHGKIVSCPLMPFAKFLGWFLSEGCLTKLPKYETIIYQKSHLEELRQDIDKCGFRYNVNFPKQFDSVPKLIIPSKELHTWLKARTGGLAGKKRIPRECFDWPKEAMEKLLDGLLIGDGHADPRRVHRFRSCHRTTSIELADDIQELCLRIGLCATIGEVPAGTRAMRGKDYQCKKQYSISIAPRDHSTFRKYDIENKPYDGMVYCVTVQPYETIIVRRNGRAMLSLNCEKDGDVYKHLSAEYHDEWFDEATTFTEFQVKYLTSRCRSSIPGVKPLIRLTTNPGGVGHGWVYARYIKPYQTNKIWKDEVTGKTLTFIPAFIKDNPAITENDPLYMQRLKELPEKKYLALAEGRWDVFEGAYFDNWDPRPGYGILPYIRVPDSHTTKFISVDWGFADPACVLWWEVTASGRVFVYRELYITRQSPKELAQMILDMSPANETYSYLVASPEIWGKKVETEGGGEPIQELMESVLKNRVPMQRANNARIAGWMKMREYLMPAPDSRPWLQISPNCTNLIRTIPSMVHDDKRKEDISPQCEDHAPESCRYGITSIADIPRSMLSPYESTYHRIIGAQPNYGRPETYLPTPSRGGY